MFKPKCKTFTVLLDMVRRGSNAFLYDKTPKISWRNCTFFYWYMAREWEGKIRETKSTLDNKVLFVLKKYGQVILI